VLVQLRSEAVVELDNIGRGKTVEDGKKAEQGGILAEIEAEGVRLLKGLEAFLKKTQGRSVTWKFTENDDDESKAAKKDRSVAEKDTWTNLVGRVQEKFDEKANNIRGRIYEWYTGVQAEEIDLVLRSSLVVKGIADKAQGDLSLDYAWLDDVTYDDWQRFHDLIRTSERYNHHAASIQNGTSVDPPSPNNIVVEALDALDADQQEIILGFQVALSDLKSRALKLFSVYTGKAAEDDDSGFFVVRDGQPRKDDLRGVDLESLSFKVGDEKTEKGAQGQDVHILPIGDEEPPVMIGNPAFDASQIIISKTPEQVEEALKNAPPVEDVRSRHEEL